MTMSTEQGTGAAMPDLDEVERYARAGIDKAQRGRAFVGADLSADGLLNPAAVLAWVERTRGLMEDVAALTRQAEAAERERDETMRHWRAVRDALRGAKVTQPHHSALWEAVGRMYDFIMRQPTGDGPGHGAERTREEAEPAPGSLHRCHAGRDGDCDWRWCPQERDGRAHYQMACPLWDVAADLDECAPYRPLPYPDLLARMDRTVEP